MKEKIKVFCCTCSVLMTLSCTNFQPLEGEYSRTNIHISQSDNRIEPDDFEIELFVPLTLPDGVVDIAGAPVLTWTGIMAMCTSTIGREARY